MFKKNILVLYMKVEQFFFNFIYFWVIDLIEKVFY